jgi:hypothetical protein
MRRVSFVFAVILGSFLIYCGQSMMNSAGPGGADGFVKDASGDPAAACCAPPTRTPTVLFDGTVSGVPSTSAGFCTFISPVMDVSALRSVVIHSPTCQFAVQVRNGKAGWVRAAEGTCNAPGPNLYQDLGRVMTLDPLLGHDLRVVIGQDSFTAQNPDGGPINCTNGPYPLTVVGFPTT